MTKLSVNINKVATIRNARGGNNPDVLQVALDCEAFGAVAVGHHILIDIFVPHLGLLVLDAHLV